MAEAMQKNPNILVLTGFMETIDANGYPVNIMDWTKNNIYNRKIIKSNLGETIFVWKPRIGCTMAIQKTVKDQLKHFKCNENFAHDIWALNIGALLGGCYHINHPVIQYRVHENNATAKRSVEMMNREERILQLENKVNYLEYIYDGANLINIVLINQDEYSVLLEAVAFYKFKLNSIRDHKVIHVFGLIPYIKIYFEYINFKQFLIDVLEILRLRDYVRVIKHFGKI
jgi:hypothetical protein